MSTAEATAAPPAGQAGQLARTPGAARGWLRLLGSELRLVFRRLRNLALLAVLAALPILLGIALRLAAPRGGGGPESSFIDQLAGNGVFLAFIAITIMIALVLPLAVAVISGDSMAGEASLGTLRYLLTVPAGRTRLLAAKYVTIVVFGLTACCVVVVAALATGAALFPIGPVTLLSGNTVSLGQGLLRVLFVTLYVAGAMAALGAIGLAISTFTEHPIGAIATVLVLAVGSEIADNIPQFATVQPYLPTHWWLDFDSLLRTPIDTSTLLRGLLSFGIYAVIFCSIAWARFTSADVTA
ncbi:MAG TPA: ABC transporter permease subunit [Streptosporangiaceae bacterium]|nr:ABC transporter permease subunit [Streptosporangiaceae bacterium]